MNGIDFVPRFGLTDATAWRLAVGLVQLHPERLRLIEMHPGGGQGDCLTVIEAGRPWEESGCLMLNRAGSAHVSRLFTDPPEERYRHFAIWGDALSNEIRTVVAHLAQQSGLREVPALPPSTRRSVSYRVIAEYVALGALHDEQWSASNGFLDTSSYGGGIREDWFEEFPGARDAMRSDRGDPLGSPAYRYWFLRRGLEGIACVSEDGIAWSRGGQVIDLYDEFAANGRRVWPALYAVVGEALR